MVRTEDGRGGSCSDCFFQIVATQVFPDFGIGFVFRSILSSRMLGNDRALGFSASLFSLAAGIVCAGFAWGGPLCLFCGRFVVSATAMEPTVPFRSV